MLPSSDDVRCTACGAAASMCQSSRRAGYLACCLDCTHDRTSMPSELPQVESDPEHELRWLPDGDDGAWVCRCGHRPPQEWPRVIVMTAVHQHERAVAQAATRPIPVVAL